MELFSSLISEIGKGLWGSIQRQLKYLFQYKENIELFTNQVSHLEAKKKDVLELVELSERRLEKPTEEVEWWLKQAEKIEDARKRLEGEEEKKKKWFCGHIPNLSSRYKLSKEAIKLSNVIKELVDSGDFNRVSHPLPPTSVIPFLCDDIVSSTAMENVMKQIMEALEDEKITRIGVHGMGGAGKTTLMKTLNNKLQTIHMFKFVIMVTVSSNPDLKKIQNEIADGLGLELGSETSEQKRAYLLSLRMEKEGPILIIFDDLWMELVLSDVGIPKRSNINIIVTSRNLDVCNQMQTQKNIKMELLPEKESWILFREKAGSVVDSSILKPLAEQVMRECRGLPLAIVAVGSTLRMEENVDSWNDALRLLKNSTPVKVEGGEYVLNMVTSLRFSYDRLKNEDAKQCFLLCGLFPEDENIHVTDLLWYAFGEGFLEVDGFEEAKNRVYAIVKRLKNCGLLLEGDLLDHVKMHDVVRDVAITIAEQDGYKTKVNARSGLEEWPQMDNIQKIKRISLIGNSIKKLPEMLLCSNLRTLLLQGNPLSEFIPSNFFESMSSLVVLDLSNTEIHSLPQSLVYLVNLSTLRISGCSKLVDISLVGYLRKLQALIATFSGILEFPKTFGELSQLKVLDLESSRIKLILPDIISKLSRLETLRIDVVDKANWIEIASLPSLTEVFVGSLPEEFLLQEVPDENTHWAKKLRRFHIFVGRGKEAYRPLFFRSLIINDVVFRAARSATSMRLAVSSPNGPFANRVINLLLERTETLILDECKGIMSMEEQELIASSSCLKFLILRNCWDMQYFIDFTTRPLPQYLFGNIQFLALAGLPKLKKICYESCLLMIPGSRSIEKQRTLKRPNTDEGNKSHDSSLSFISEVVAIDLVNAFNEIARDGYQKEQTMPGPGSSLTNIPTQFAFLDILQRLQILAIYKCHALENLFSLCFALNHLNQLHTLKVYACSKLVALMGEEGEEDDDDDNCNNDETGLATTYMGVLPRLRKLTLDYLPNLTGFSFSRRRHLYFHFPSLRNITISRCFQMKALPFDSNTAPNLEIFKCDSNWFHHQLHWKDESTKSRFSSRLQHDGMESGTNSKSG